MAKNRAFVRYTKSGKIIPGSMIVTNGSYPKDGTYVEVFTNECCNPANKGGSSLPLKAVYIFVQGVITKENSTPQFSYIPGGVTIDGIPTQLGPQTTVSASEKGQYYCVVYHDDTDYPKVFSGSVIIKEAGPCKPGSAFGSGCTSYTLTETSSTAPAVITYLGCGESELTSIVVNAGGTKVVCVQSDVVIPYIINGVATITEGATCTP